MINNGLPIMYIKPLLFLLLSLGPLASISEAGEHTYDCVIKNAYSLDDTGILKASGWQKIFAGNKFQVSRETGIIVGETLTTVFAKDTRVINFGTSDNSFKAIAEFKGQFQIIEIKEFKEGIEKPFVAYSMGGAGIVTGICN